MEKLSQTKTILMFMAKNGGLFYPDDRDVLLHPINNVFNDSRRAISNALYQLKHQGMVFNYRTPDGINMWEMTDEGWFASYECGINDINDDFAKQSDVADDLTKQLDEMKLKLDYYKQRLAEKDYEIKRLKAQQQVSHVDVDASINSNLEKTFKHLAETFKILQQNFTHV